MIAFFEHNLLIIWVQRYTKFSKLPNKILKSCSQNSQFSLAKFSKPYLVKPDKGHPLERHHRFEIKPKGQTNFIACPFAYMPMHEVVPSAVSTAVITDAMICSVHFRVSLFVIKYLLSVF